jgi:hypothetical protein
VAGDRPVGDRRRRKALRRGPAGRGPRVPVAAGRRLRLLRLRRRPAGRSGRDVPAAGPGRGRLPDQRQPHDGLCRRPDPGVRRVPSRHHRVLSGQSGSVRRPRGPGASRPVGRTPAHHPGSAQPLPCSLRPRLGARGRRWRGHGLDHRSGISNALRDADGLAAAVIAGLGGARPLPAALADHHRRRDARLRPVFDFTVGLTRFRGLRPVERAFFAAVADRPEETQRFLAAFTGVTPINRYLSLATAARVLVGPRRSSRRPAAA